MSIFIFRPVKGYSPLNILLMLACFSVAYLTFWAGKKYITTPRMGQVTFGPARKKKRTLLAIVLGLVVLLQIAFVIVQFAWRANPASGQWITSNLKDGDTGSLLVASIGALFIGPSMLLIAWFTDFTRGFYIAILMALGLFLMILVNQPLYPILLGLLIIIPGIILFVNFLRKYPKPERRNVRED